MTTEQRKQIIQNLTDKESRDFFVEEFINTSVPFQIRAIRQSLGKTQRQLAQDLETKQARISQLENPDYGNFSLNTLKKLASIFDVALIVKFAPFSELVDLFDNWSPAKIAVETYAADVRLRENADWIATDSSSRNVKVEIHTTPLARIEPPSRSNLSFIHTEKVDTYGRIKKEIASQTETTRAA